MLRYPRRREVLDTEASEWLQYPTALDAPKTLAGGEERARRQLLLLQHHVLPLTQLTGRIRSAMGPSYQVPEFDPLDGGVESEVLFLLEAPGPKAVASGFVSRNNPDETARNFFLLNAEAGIDRRLTVTWNAVPWYIGTGAKIRPATARDVREADQWLTELLTHLVKLRIVVLVGRKSVHARNIVAAERPGVAILEMPHPSPMHVNRHPDNRSHILSVLREVASRMTVSYA
jgi:uracil-DNA glycosylase